MDGEQTRREMLQWTGGALAAGVCGAVSAAQGDSSAKPAGGRPNILVFMTDQQRGDTVPPYRRAKTPNLDRFCKEGVTFSQAYCPSPHCCPSRATFFSGMYPSEHGVWNNVDVGNALSRGPIEGTRLFSDDMKDAGYDLYFSGKWHVSSLDMPSDRGWKVNPGQPYFKSHFDQPGVLEPKKPGDWHAFNGLPPQGEWHKYALLAQRPEQTQRYEAQILRPGYGTYVH
ncbi:MAG TPA: sulfatase-like hydrolase/transferase, partial [Tepidisphaeraceae bacterium]|nr:sulfatase-like hydrolase/transferase [Tepidisphaeraceae bacterium]